MRIVVVSQRFGLPLSHTIKQIESNPLKLAFGVYVTQRTSYDGPFNVVLDIPLLGPQYVEAT